MIITANGTPTYVICEGSGTPVVLLHGWAATTECWQFTLDNLKIDHQVIVPDLPGHGRSGDGPHPYSLRFYSQWLNDVLDALGIEQAILIGNSLGGAISLAYALEHPDRILSLIPVDSLGVSDRVPFRTMQYIGKRLPYLLGIVLGWRHPKPLLNYLNGMVFIDPWGLKEPIIEMARLNAAHGIWYIWSGLRVLLADFLTPGKRHTFTQRLSSITAPTMIMWGRHDGLLPVYDAFTGNRFMPKSRVCIFENSAHLPFMEEPDDFNHIVRAFLASLQSPL